jgi:23S rRNA (guanosine2251-2'-O)-methyltransferase
MAKLHTLTGFHAVSARLKRYPDSIGSIYIAAERGDGRAQRLIELATEQAVTLHRVDRARLDGMATAGKHQGVIAMVEELPPLPDARTILENLDHPALVLILDGITDPHNLGACIRSADAFGADCVIIPKDNAAPFTEVAAKAASGAMESVPLVVVTNLARSMAELKEQGVWIYGADGEAPQTLAQQKISGPTAYAMGAEGSGLRRLTREHCDAVFKIPMHGMVESLNVSVATGVVLYHHRAFAK